MASGKSANNEKTRRIFCLKHDDRGCDPFGQHPVSQSCAGGTNIPLVGTCFVDMANDIEKKTTVILDFSRLRAVNKRSGALRNRTRLFLF